MFFCLTCWALYEGENMYIFVNVIYTAVESVIYNLFI